MPVDVDKLKDKYNAQSELNRDALAAFVAANPDVYVGNTFTDYHGLDWEYVFVGPFNNSVSVFAAYINDSAAVTDYITNVNSVMLNRALYTYSDNFTTTDAGGGIADTVYVRPDMKYGQILQITVDGGAPLIPATDFTFNSDTGTLTFLIAISPGQVIDTLYKKNPNYQGYP